MPLADGLHDVPRGKVAMAVTHLEMHAPAATDDMDAPQGLTLRRITPDLAGYRALFTRVGQDWLWYGRLVMADADLQAILDDPQVHLYTLTRNGTDHAILELDFRTSGQCELAYFGLTCDLIGTGAGRYLMNQAIRLAWAQPITRFHVHTCTIDSPQALGFYIKNGFVPYRRQIEVDDDPRLLGLLPENAAPHVPLIRT